MFEILMTVAFVYLVWQFLKLAFRVTWGLAKLGAVILFVLSLPSLIGCLLMAGGALLLVPVALIALAWCILKACL
jgi:hypothetical protein